MSKISFSGTMHDKFRKLFASLSLEHSDCPEIMELDVYRKELIEYLCNDKGCDIRELKILSNSALLRFAQAKFSRDRDTEVYNPFVHLCMSETILPPAYKEDGTELEYCDVEFLMPGLAAQDDVRAHINKNTQRFVNRAIELTDQRMKSKEERISHKLEDYKITGFWYDSAGRRLIVTVSV